MPFSKSKNYATFIYKLRMHGAAVQAEWKVVRSFEHTNPSKFEEPWFVANNSNPKHTTPFEPTSMPT